MMSGIEAHREAHRERYQLPKWHSAASGVARRSNPSSHGRSRPISLEAPPLQSAYDRLITRITPVRLALGILLLASGLTRMASAQTGLGGAIGTTTTSLTADDLLIVVQQTPGVALPDFDLQRFFNIANCNCNTPVYLYFTFSQSGFAKKPTLPEGSIEFWTGLNCNNVTVRNCQKLGDTLMLTTFGANSGVVITTDTQTLSQNFGQPAVSGTTTITDGGVVIGDGGTNVNGTCASGVAFSQTIWALVTFTGDAPYDVAATLAVSIDMAPPPPPPPPVTVNPGNEALIVNWTDLDTSVNSDLLGYQVLCDRAGEFQVFRNGTFGPGFRTCASTPIPSDISSHILGLDEAFACSPLLTTTASSYRVKILQNGIFYGASVVAIDTHYNASAPAVQWVAPVKTLSFYDVYRNGDESNTKPGQQPEPGRANGGYCAVSGTTSATAGAAGLTALALVGGLAFGARRRRRRPRP